MTDPMKAWMADKRPIFWVKLEDEELLSTSDGIRFERFERPGEHCLIPWLRVIYPAPDDGLILELPLNRVQKIVFDVV